MVAVIFKIASLLVIIGGLISAADLSSDQTYTGSKGPLYAGIIAGTIFMAAASRSPAGTPISKEWPECGLCLRLVCPGIAVPVPRCGKPFRHHEEGRFSLS